MSEFGREVESYFGSTVAKFIKIISVLFLIWIILSLAFGFWPFSAAAGVAKAVVNERAIIQNYQWYYDQYAMIQAQTANYESMPSDAVEKNGMRMVLNNAISEYNSRSLQITRNLWKAKDLPYQLNLITGGLK